MYGSEFKPTQTSHPCYTRSFYLLNKRVELRQSTETISYVKDTEF